MRVLIADDHALVRAGLRALLEKIPSVEVVGEAREGREALDLTETRQPHVLFMDIAMAGLNGLEAAQQVIGKFPNVKVIILSMHANEEYVAHALRAGVAGYLLKDAAAVELELALRAVARGETYLSPAISRQLTVAYMEQMKENPHPDDPLTPRQREILQLIAEGKGTKEIAFTLKISVKTVETHRAQLMDRLDIHDIAGLVRYAIRKGLVFTG